MKIYFWDGSEFGGNASPCCEVHVLGHRIKLLTITKSGPVLFRKERMGQGAVPKWKYYDTPNENLKLLWFEKATPILVERKKLG